MDNKTHTTIRTLPAPASRRQACWYAANPGRPREKPGNEDVADSQEELTTQDQSSFAYADHLRYNDLTCAASLR